MEVPRRYSTSNSARNSDDRRLLRREPCWGGCRVLKKYQGIGPKLAHRCALTGTEHLTPFSAFPFFPALFLPAPFPAHVPEAPNPLPLPNRPPLDGRVGVSEVA